MEGKVIRVTVGCWLVLAERGKQWLPSSGPCPDGVNTGRLALGSSNGLVNVDAKAKAQEESLRLC